MPSLLVIPKVRAWIVASLSRPALSNTLFATTIFFSATQLGFHFWPNSALVYGIRVDYLAPTLYFLDCLILTYLITRRSDLVGHPTRAELSGILFPLLLTNLLFSTNPPSTLSWSLHFLLYLLFFVTWFPGSDPLSKSWLQAKMFSLKVKTGSDPVSVLKIVFPLALLFQTILALAQVTLGHSVGGLMYYLGERTVSVGMPSIAMGTFLGVTTLRAYGTFSHPNILAGWAVIAGLIILRLVRLQRPEFSRQRAVRRSDLVGVVLRGQTLLVPLTFGFIALSILLTQSRSAALALFGIIIPFQLIQSLRTRILYFAIIALLVIGNWSLVIPDRADLSASQRFTLQGLSLSVIRHYPIFGTGAQASISTYPTISPNFRILQPDHNSFTLLLSWFGIFGVIAILFTMHSVIGHFIPLAPLLLLDHYLLTSPQGLFIFLLYLFVVHSSHAQKAR